MLLADEALDRALKEADDTSSDAGDLAAAELLEKKAAPAADDAFAKANAANVSSAWGKDEKQKLVALLGDRRADVMKYAAALRSGDLDQRLKALEAQLGEEKRAIDLAGEIRGQKP